jgi:hypothetical protein
LAFCGEQAGKRKSWVCLGVTAGSWASREEMQSNLVSKKPLS